MISHFSFDLHFPDHKWYWAFFHVSVGYLHVFFGKISIQVFCLFFNQVIYLFIYLMCTCLTCLCILDINSLSVISFANVFSQVVILFCWWLPLAQSVKIPPVMQEIWIWPWVWKIPWRRKQQKQQPIPVFLPEESQGQRSLTGYGVTRVRHDIVTAPIPPFLCAKAFNFN